MPRRKSLLFRFLLAGFQILLISMVARRDHRIMTNVSGVHAERFRGANIRLRPGINDVLPRGFEQFHIMHVGPAGDQRQRDATRVDQYAALAPI